MNNQNCTCQCMTVLQQLYELQQANASLQQQLMALQPNQQMVPMDQSQGPSTWTQPQLMVPTPMDICDPNSPGMIHTTAHPEPHHAVQLVIPPIDNGHPLTVTPMDDTTGISDLPVVLTTINQNHINRAEDTCSTTAEPATPTTYNNHVHMDREMERKEDTLGEAIKEILTTPLFEDISDDEEDPREVEIVNNVGEETEVIDLSDDFFILFDKSCRCNRQKFRKN